ncbi:hypothetical protein [Bacillus seohaeanensis]|jgi:hypothetical protein|uniref:Uncharacterized protein n=1 Tax=Bacillus seohaeanensis TaxID=284580 RepID=A0ABW5RQ47_9BACI
MYYNENNQMYPENHLQFDYDWRNVKHLCHKYRNYYVIGQMQDGTQIEGIIEDMNDDAVTMLIPEMVEEDAFDNRQYIVGAVPAGGYRRQYRRYRRRRFPYHRFVFPFIIPFPFYY